MKQVAKTASNNEFDWSTCPPELLSRFQFAADPNHDTLTLAGCNIPLVGNLPSRSKIQVWVKTLCAFLGAYPHIATLDVSHMCNPNEGKREPFLFFINQLAVALQTNTTVKIKHLNISHNHITSLYFSALMEPLMRIKTLLSLYANDNEITTLYAPATIALASNDTLTHLVLMNNPLHQQETECFIEEVAEDRPNNPIHISWLPTVTVAGTVAPTINSSARSSSPATSFTTTSSRTVLAFSSSGNGAATAALSSSSSTTNLDDTNEPAIPTVNESSVNHDSMSDRGKNRQT